MNKGNILYGKKGLIINIESTDININNAEIFQISLGFGDFKENNKWHFKTWRVEGAEIPQIYLSNFKDGKIPVIPDEDIKPIGFILEKVNKLISSVDVVCCWFHGFHLALLAAEMKRNEIQFPFFHTFDANLLFKESTRFLKDVPKTLDSAINFFGNDPASFGNENPHKKAQAIKWVMDRMLESDDYDPFFNMNNMELFSSKQESANAMSHLSFRSFLKKKGKDISDLRFSPWVPFCDDYEPFVDGDNPLFADAPEMLVSFDEYTRPENRESNSDGDIAIITDKFRDEITSNLQRKIIIKTICSILETEQYEIEINPTYILGTDIILGTHIDMYSGKDGETFLTVHISDDTDIKQLIKQVENAKFSLMGHGFRYKFEKRDNKFTNDVLIFLLVRDKNEE
jgi:hypothetical protein